MLLAESEQAAWFGFLTVPARITREFANLLVAAHGMPLFDYEVLLKLSIAGAGCGCRSWPTRRCSAAAA